MTTRNKILLGIVSLFFLTSYQNNSCNCDYIKNYYQLVYQAEIHYLSDEFSEAYTLFKKAESNCGGLLNQEQINEPRIMAECCMRLGKEKEAIHYLKIYVDHGMKLSTVEGSEIFAPLKKNPEWNNLVVYASAANAAFDKKINKELREEIIQMKIADQKVRQKPINWQLANKTDSLHEIRIKEIIKQYGFPNADLIGPSTWESRTDITVMLMHFNDTTYFKPVLLDFIRKGQAAPNLLANMIDSRLRFAGQFSYGIYDNADSTQIKDFHKIDERRMAIGLPPFKLRKKKMEILRKKYPELFQK